MHPTSDLVDGRGAMLCFSVACRVHQPVWSTMFHAARRPFDLSRRADLVAAFHRVPIAAIAVLGEETGFVPAVADAVDGARYWQEPTDEDVVLRFPEVRAALRPIAAAITASGATTWWSSPMDREALRCTSRYEPGTDGLSPPVVGGAVDQLRDWRRRTLEHEAAAARDRPADLTARYGGHWWSIPAPSRLIGTTRPVGRLGSATLVWEEDSVGASAAEIWPMTCTPDARVLEITGPQDWAALVRRYPLDNTAEKRHDWYRVTGSDRRWLIPDYAAVAADWDAVHLTLAGYLTTAGRPVAVDRDRSTLLAGWDPDRTWWLTDTVDIAGPPIPWYEHDPRDGDAWSTSPPS